MLNRDDYRSLAQQVDVELQTRAGGRLGFALLIFPFDSPGIANYVSNAERADMVKALREAADRIEGSAPGGSDDG